MNRIPVNSALLTWAPERAGLERQSLVWRFPKLAEGENGERQPTLRQNAARNASAGKTTDEATGSAV